MDIWALVTQYGPEFLSFLAGSGALAALLKLSPDEYIEIFLKAEKVIDNVADDIRGSDAYDGNDSKGSGN